MKHWMKAALALMLAMVSTLGMFGCSAAEQPQWMKEYLCVEHTYDGGVVERAATCVREGRIRKTCTTCGAETVESIAKTAHQTYTVPAREATCAQSGYAEHEACIICNNDLGEYEKTARLTCAHDQDVYIGLGETQCPICGDVRRPVEFAVEGPSDVVFETGYTFRFYIPTAESEAWIVFNLPVRMKVTAQGRVPDPSGRYSLPGESSEIILKEVKIGYSSQKGGYVSFMTLEGEEIITTVDATVSQESDYIEISLSNRKYEKTRETDAELSIWFTLSVENVKSIECSGGGYIVRNCVGRWKK